MGVNSTKLNGYRTLIQEVVVWLRNIPGYQEEDYNPYFEAICELEEALNQFGYIEQDLVKQKATVMEEPIEQGE